MALDLKASISWLRALVVFSYLVYAPYYLVWRLGTFNPHAAFFSWVIWGAEVFGYFTSVLHIFMVSRLTYPTATAPPDNLSVDVFITTYNESVNLLRHTLLAATRMEYPHQTWLLDDGNRPEMAALAKELGCRYLARSENTDAKAGNLNNALAHSHADFVAVFDADHVPHKDFLNKTLGFFRDEKLAFVQTPQDFYNLDSYQHRRHKRLSYIWTEQSLFFRVIQRGKDRWNAGYFCGSCAVLRRSALNAIGGFATGTVTEDLHTSIRIHKKGFHTVYYPESLAFGLAPHSIEAFLLQRQRWGQGAMQVWHKEGIVFVRGLTFAQRLNYLASVLTYFDGWQKFIFYLAPAVVLLTGVMPIRSLGYDFFVHFLPFYILCFWAYEEASRGFGRTLLIEQYNMARFATFVRATLGSFGRRLKFTVTPKEGTFRNESLVIVPQLLVLSLSIVAIIVGGVLWYLWHSLSPGAFWANVVWASINMGLAGAVIRFTLQKKHRRSEYRFPIPLPAFVMTPNGEKKLGLMEDISANGCKFISEAPLTDLSTVSGEIYLPGGRMPFTASIKRYLEPLYPKARTEADVNLARPSRKKISYGLHFQWASTNDAVQLENFLYGSDLQWQILDLHERVSTPVSCLLTRLFGKKNAVFAQVSTKEWLPIVYRNARKTVPHENFGVLSRTDWSQRLARLILFEMIPAGTELSIYIFGHEPGDKLQGKVVAVEKLKTTAATVYVAQLQLQHKSEASRKKRRVWLSSELPLMLMTLTMLVTAYLWSPMARAQEWLGLTGLEVAGSHNAYLFAGVVKPLEPEIAPGQAWVQRYWFDWLQYRFDSDGQEVRANAPGASASLGYRRTDAAGYWAVYAGLGYRHTTLTPDRPNAEVRGGQASLQLLTEMDHRFMPNWRFAAAAQYAVGPDSYWTRFKLLHASMSNSWWHGAELIFQGDPDYHATKIGYVLDEWPLSKQLNANFKLGAIKTKGIDTSAYVGVEFVGRFDAK